MKGSLGSNHLPCKLYIVWLLYKNKWIVQLLYTTRIVQPGESVTNLIDFILLLLLLLLFTQDL